MPRRRGQAIASQPGSAAAIDRADPRVISGPTLAFDPVSAPKIGLRVRSRQYGRAWRPNFALATLTPSSHNASMEEAHVFTIDVTQDARQRGRYRWSVSENMKMRDTSFYSFTTRREAQADADKFVEKLKAIWQPHR
jgi:hypothetical protein